MDGCRPSVPRAVVTSGSQAGRLPALKLELRAPLSLAADSCVPSGYDTTVPTAHWSHITSHHSFHCACDSLLRC